VPREYKISLPDSSTIAAAAALTAAATAPTSAHDSSLHPQPRAAGCQSCYRFSIRAAKDSASAPNEELGDVLLPSTRISRTS
jgi:hypothetical protein